MRLSEAKIIANEPAKHMDRLQLAHLKLGNVILRVMPGSIRQKELQELRRNIEKMPKHLWYYNPK